MGRATTSDRIRFSYPHARLGTQRTNVYLDDIPVGEIRLIEDDHGDPKYIFHSTHPCSRLVRIQSPTLAWAKVWAEYQLVISPVLRHETL